MPGNAPMKATLTASDITDLLNRFTEVRWPSGLTTWEDAARIAVVREAPWHMKGGG